jgi:hypothetical protein
MMLANSVDLNIPPVSTIRKESPKVLLIKRFKKNKGELAHAETKRF